MMSRISVAVCLAVLSTVRAGNVAPSTNVSLSVEQELLQVFENMKEGFSSLNQTMTSQHHGLQNILTAQQPPQPSVERPSASSSELQAIQKKLTAPELQAIQKKLTALDTKLEETQTKLKSTQTRLASTRTTLESTQKKLASTETMLEATRRTVIKAEVKQESTRTKLQALDAKLKRTELKQEYTRTNLQALRRKLERAERKQRSTRTKLDATRTKLQRTQSQLAATRSKVAATEAQQNTAGRMLRSTQATLRTLQSNLKSGSTYVRWGRKSCSNASQLVYSGVVGGSWWKHPGAAANPLCLTLTPQTDNTAVPRHTARLYGAEYEHISNHHNRDVPCSVCFTPQPTTIMIPTTHTCPNGWTTQYRGHLSAGHPSHKGATEYVCLDKYPENASNGRMDHNGHLFYLTTAWCGSLPCPPYVQNQVVLCVVCSK